MTDKTPAEVLTEAADHIERVGLHKGGFFRRSEVAVPLDERPCCALGAIGLASGYFIANPASTVGWDSVYATVGATVDGDADVTSADEVASLDEAAVDLLQVEISRIPNAQHLSVPGWSDAIAKDAAEVAAMMRKAAQA